MWFVFALITALCWGGADLFYKRGSDEDDRLSHLKIVVMVGLVMGIHAVGYMIVEGISFHPLSMITYLPVSSMYILSMTLGYVGLRYIELSVASPVQNSSGAITVILLYIFFTHELSALQTVALVLVLGGVIGIALIEKKQEHRVPVANDPDKKYRVGVLAILFPILYALFDGLGTFADGVYLDEMSLISENDALLAYEFTFLLCGVVSYLYIRLVKKQPFNPLRERDKGLAAILETGGQFFYVFAMAGNAIIAAPMIASYSIFSILLSRLFLKEKLSRGQYAVIVAVMVGIAMLGVAEEL